MSEFNAAVFMWLNATAASPAWLVPLARFVTVELPEWMLVGSVTAFLVGDARVRRCVLRIALAMVLAWVFARLGQYLFPMPRPFSLGIGTAWMAHAESAGFPSTHATVAFAFAGAVALSTRGWPSGLAAFAVAAAVAWSRICLGLHFPIDLVAGALVGCASACLSGLVPYVVPRIRVAL